jgi:hypothetical protein
LTQETASVSYFASLLSLSISLLIASAAWGQVRNKEVLTKAIYWGAGSLATDGTECPDPVETPINSGPTVYVVNCSDSDAATLEGSVTMPDNYDGGTVTFTLSVVDVNAAPSGTSEMDFSVQCRGHDDTVNSTYGTEVPASISHTGLAQADVAQGTTAAVTGNGTCQPADLLFWRAQVDATASDATMSQILVLGVKMEYTEISQ